MRFIDTSAFEPPEKWLEKANEITEELKLAKTKTERDAIIDKNKGHWGKIKPELRKLSYQKCWYSEARETYSYYHVEHFRPKKKCIDLNPNHQHDGYWWLCFAWQNYRICGAVGNSVKGNRFAVKKNQALAPDDDLDDEEIYLLDPTSIEDVKMVTFNENGEIMPSSPNKSDWYYQKAEYTIQTLELNFERLKDERKRLWREMWELIQEINQAITKYNQSPSASRRSDLNRLKEKVRERIAPCSEFSSTYKACLKMSREDWALDMLIEDLDPQIYCKHYLYDQPASDS